MRIAIYTGTYVKDKDGVARTLYELVPSIKKRGHRVEIWTPDPPEIGRENANVHPFTSIPVALYPAYRIGSFSIKAIKEMDAYGPDVIHISTPDVGGLEVLLYAKRKGIPVIGVYHTDFPAYLSYYHINFLSAPFWLYLRLFYNACRIVFAPTKEICDTLTRHSIVGARIWSRGIHVDRFNPTFRSEELRRKWGAEGKTVILYSGRFVWYKDLQVLVDVYDMFQKDGLNNVIFVLLGSGPIERDLKKSMKKAIFPGYLTGEALSRAYASADIFLFPSSTETFGNVVLEAISSGLPPVVSDEGGCKEIVKESGCGIISKSKDAKIFFENCKKFVDDLDLYRSHKKSGVAYANSQTWEKVNEPLVSSYEKEGSENP